MDEQIAKLQAATDEAEAQRKVCREVLEAAELELQTAKEKYKKLSEQLKEQSGDDLQVNDTELPELIETRIRAKHVCETVEARYATNKRHLEAMILKRDATTTTTTSA